jgi:hypothetical protein
MTSENQNEAWSTAKANEDVYSKEAKIIVDDAKKMGYEVITMPDAEVAKIRQTAIDKYGCTSQRA